MNQPTPPPWRWLNPGVLVADYGPRRVVLMASKHPISGIPQLHTANSEGILERLDPYSPDGRKIAAAGEMAKELSELAGSLEEWAGRLETTNAIISRQIFRRAHDIRAFLSGIEP